MMGGLSLLSTHTSPCICLDIISSSRMNSMGKKQSKSNIIGSLELSSSFVNSGKEFLCVVRNTSMSLRKGRNSKSLVIVNELGGQYEENFGDVKTQILNYFTYKAARTVLHQLYEMNPTQYIWLYNFLIHNKPGDGGKAFIRNLAKEKQDLAERVMVTRLHLYGKWIKKCDHGEIYKNISDENLELMREKLLETIVWPSDDNTEKIG